MGREKPLDASFRRTLERVSGFFLPEAWLPYSRIASFSARLAGSSSSAVRGYETPCVRLWWNRDQYGWPARSGSKISAVRNSDPGVMTEPGWLSISRCRSKSNLSISCELKVAFDRTTSSSME